MFSAVKIQIKKKCLKSLGRIRNPFLGSCSNNFTLFFIYYAYVR